MHVPFLPDDRRRAQRALHLHAAPAAMAAESGSYGRALPSSLHTISKNVNLWKVWPKDRLARAARRETTTLGIPACSPQRRGSRAVAAGSLSLEI
jgi:hypothetical protein